MSLLECAHSSALTSSPVILSFLIQFIGEAFCEVFCVTYWFFSFLIFQFYYFSEFLYLHWTIFLYWLPISFRCLYPPGIHSRVGLCALWFLWTYFQWFFLNLCLDFSVIQSHWHHYCGCSNFEGVLLHSLVISQVFALGVVHVGIGYWLELLIPFILPQEMLVIFKRD